jgi:4-hydroxy-2-oxoheptanedioate aldolase
MTPIPLKQRIGRADVLVGVILNQQSPDLVEICGLLGFGFIFLDAEHGIVDFQLARDMIRAGDYANIPVLVRVPRNEQSAILPFLEAGAAGVIVPHVQSAIEARAAVDAVKYPPLGHRGAGAASRANGHGLRRSATEHFRSANDETVVVAMIEDSKGIANIAEIGQVDGVDLVFIGPMDLALDLGHPGEPQHPAVRSEVRSAFSKALAAQLHVGTVGYTAEAAWEALELGAQIVVQTTNNLFVPAAREYLAKVAEPRAVIGRGGQPS